MNKFFRSCPLQTEVPGKPGRKQRCYEIIWSPVKRNRKTEKSLVLRIDHSETNKRRFRPKWCVEPGSGHKGKEIFKNFETYHFCKLDHIASLFALCDRAQGSDLRALISLEVEKESRSWFLLKVWFYRLSMVLPFKFGATGYEKKFASWFLLLFSRIRFHLRDHKMKEICTVTRFLRYLKKWEMVCTLPNLRYLRIFQAFLRALSSPKRFFSLFSESLHLVLICLVKNRNFGNWPPPLYY